RSDALAVERARCGAAGSQGIVHDGGAAGGDALTEAIEEERCATVERRARDRAREMPEQRRGHLWIEDDRALRGRHGGRARPPASAPPSAASSRPSGWRFAVYQESRCMLPLRRATGVATRLKLEPLYAPAKPRLDA